MRVLIDTHILMWSLVEPARLSMAARAVMLDDDNERLFSAASIWEVAIKAGLGKPDFTTDPRNLLRLSLQAGFRELLVTSAAAARVADLPLHHRDPFDRLLVAQAIDTGAVLLTVDRALVAYAPHILLVA